jgi:hypothetical protein
MHMVPRFFFICLERPRVNIGGIRLKVTTEPVYTGRPCCDSCSTVLELKETRTTRVEVKERLGMKNHASLSSIETELGREAA